MRADTIPYQYLGDKKWNSKNFWFSIFGFVWQIRQGALVQALCAACQAAGDDKYTILAGRDKLLIRK